jgi:adenylate cyclase
LTDVPRTFRTNVLPKMLLLSFMIGTIPLSIVTFITLDQIGLIQSDPKRVSVFASQMPHVLIFIFALAFAALAILSFLISRSVSEPFQRMGEAMKKIREGKLNVSISVVSNDEMGVMAAGFNRMAEGLRERDFIRETFGSYVSQEVAAEILTSNAGVKLAGELRDISILVSDLRGFTRLTATMEPQLVLKMINAYLEAMTEVIVRHDGTIDEIMGDGLLVFFGAPRRLPDHARRAVECALAMQSASLLLNEEYEKQSLPSLEMGIGINCGELVVGSIGSEKRRKYGAMGSPINVAYRVEAQTSGGEILVTPEIHERLGQSLIVQSLREVTLKGIEDPMILYQVVGIKASQLI